MEENFRIRAAQLGVRIRAGAPSEGGVRVTVGVGGSPSGADCAVESSEPGSVTVMVISGMLPDDDQRLHCDLDGV